LGLVGATAATVGGYLGGHLLQSLGVGVDETAVRKPPSEWTCIAAADEITEMPRRMLAREAPVIVLRYRGEMIALDARCPHRGAPLEEGEVHDGCLTCPWHGSQFRLDDGALVRGPSTVDLPVYECRVTREGVEVRAR
jgi:nitrite reductase/ring-hydroxylating ferredoxin subunit